jgi:hypothetical protein
VQIKERLKEIVLVSTSYSSRGATAVARVDLTPAATPLTMIQRLVKCLTRADTPRHRQIESFA